MIKCQNCGRDNADNFNFCLDCGTELSLAPAATEAPSPSGAGVGINTEPIPLKRPKPSAPDFAAAPPPPPPPAPPLGASLGAEPLPAPPRIPTPAITGTPIEDALPSSSATVSATSLAEATAPTDPVAQSAAPEPIAPPAPSAPSAPPAPVTPPAPIAPPAPPPAAVAPASTAPNTEPLPTSTAQMGAAVPEPGGTGTIDCPKCGHNNPSSMKFCGECGQRLAEQAGPQPTGGAGKTMFLHAADMSSLTQPKARLVTIDQSGNEGMTFNIAARETLCGRSNGTILFFDDPFVSPSHCTFVFENGKLLVRDEQSLNGIFIRVRGEGALADEDLLRMGRQLFRLESGARDTTGILPAREGDDARLWGSPDPEAWGRLVQILDNGHVGEVHLLRGEECRIGREVGDIVVPGDGFISASHCALSPSGEGIRIRDLGSSNGTYVKLRGDRELNHDDFILVGNQMLRVELT